MKINKRNSKKKFKSVQALRKAYTIKSKIKSTIIYKEAASELSTTEVNKISANELRITRIVTWFKSLGVVLSENEKEDRAGFKRMANMLLFDKGKQTNRCKILI